MSTTIKLKKSGVSGNVPASSNLEFGELALNYADGILFYKDPGGTVRQIASGGNTFNTIDANGTLIIADANNDILTITPGTGTYITGDGITDTITIGVNLSDSYLSTSNNQVATANALNAVFAIANTAYSQSLSANLTVKEIFTSNNYVVNAFSNIQTIQFDADSGLAVVDESNNTVTIQLNSTFKFWEVNGATGLIAVGLDTVNFITGYGIEISANNANTPKSITFSAPLIGTVYDTANNRVLRSGDTMTGDLHIIGALTATTKSFVIDHPTKPGKKLRYGSLEGPENGVYVRGILKGDNVIKLPDYWNKLVDKNSITVHLTPIGKFQKLYMKEVKNNKVYVDSESLFGEIHCSYVVYGVRKDVAKLNVEY